MCESENLLEDCFILLGKFQGSWRGRCRYENQVNIRSRGYSFIYISLRCKEHACFWDEWFDCTWSFLPNPLCQRQTSFSNRRLEILVSAAHPNNATTFSTKHFKGKRNRLSAFIRHNLPNEWNPGASWEFPAGLCGCKCLSILSFY